MRNSRRISVDVKSNWLAHIEYYGGVRGASLPEKTTAMSIAVIEAHLNEAATGDSPGSIGVHGGGGAAGPGFTENMATKR